LEEVEEQFRFLITKGIYPAPTLLYLFTMSDKLRSFFRWLFRIDRQQDPLLERYLQRNREALERQREEPTMPASESKALPPQYS
jgi:hypothetical protein